MTSRKKAMRVAVGSAFVAGIAMTPMAGAAENPFAMQSLDRGYMVASNHMQGKCGAGKCGASMMDADKDGKVSKKEFMDHHEAIFASMDKNNNGVLDADEAGPGKAAAPKAMEGKCAQGKCGGMKR